jgi:arginyl-tRNA synthetase
MVEFSSPNTNKPLHLGHLRNIFLGDALSNLLPTQGGKVIRATLINDRGIHIAKSMLAYQLYGQNDNPKRARQKGDHFVGEFYLHFEQDLLKEKEKYAQEKSIRIDQLSDQQKDKFDQEFLKNSSWYNQAKELLQKWEAGDKEINNLSKKMNRWAIDGFNQTYRDLGIRFNQIDLESQTYQQGKKIVQEGLEKNLFSRTKDGAIIVDLKNDGLDQKILLRSDGTSVYLTQDLSTAQRRFNQYHLNRLIYVVANEQDYHFRVFFKVVKMLGFDWTDKLHHLSYGLVNLPQGRMKSREGTVVDADDLIQEMTQMAKKKILANEPHLDQRLLLERAQTIALAAIKFHFLKNKASSDMIFNPEESLSFEGDTGPYLEYVSARIQSIIAKANLRLKVYNFELLTHPQEKIVVNLLAEYGEVLEKAAQNLDPTILSRWLLDLAHQFTKFYEQCPVLQAEKELKLARLGLVAAILQVISSGLKILGIEPLKRM